MAQTLAILVLLFAEGGFRRPSVFALKVAATSVSLLPAVNAIGLILPLLILRPKAHIKRWPPHTLAVLVGAATVCNIWPVEWAVNKFDFWPVEFAWNRFDFVHGARLRFIASILACFVLMTLGTSLVSLLLYRAFIDRPGRDKKAISRSAELVSPEIS